MALYKYPLNYKNILKSSLVQQNKKDFKDYLDCSIHLMAFDEDLGSLRTTFIRRKIAHHNVIKAREIFLFEKSLFHQKLYFESAALLCFSNYGKSNLNDSCEKVQTCERLSKTFLSPL